MTDLKHAWRSVWARPAFTLMVVVPLALGIGMNTAIFSAVHAVLLRSLPYDDPERLVRVWEARPRMGPNAAQIAAFEMGHYREWREDDTVFDGMAAYGNVSFNLTGGTEPRRIEGQSASPALFTMLGVEPLHGRYFAPEEEIPGNDRVILLSYDLWQRQFGGEPGAVSQTLSLDGETYTVVGVMPPAFRFPDAATEFWVPQVMEPASPTTPGEVRIELAPVIAKLKPGVTVASAEAAAEAFLNNLRETSEMARRINDGVTIHLTSLHEQLVGPVRPQLLVLSVAVGFVLLIACANVANLFLVRARGRERDFAVRAALGAGRRRLVTRLLLESALFGALGGAAGALVAFWGVRLLRLLRPSDLPLLDGVALNAPVLWFNVAVAATSALLVGLVPALRASRIDVLAGLKGSTLGSGGASSASGRSVSRHVLAVAEVALALTLFVAAGLMLRSFLTLTNVHPGYEPQGVLTFRLNLPASKYATPSTQRAVYDRLLEETRSLPGVSAAGIANQLPLDSGRFITSLQIEGQPPPDDPMSSPRASIRVVSEEFFRSMGMQIVAGRAFEPGDDAGSPTKVIVNESLVASYLEDTPPVGAVLSGLGEIVGVVANVRHEGLDAVAEPEIYLDYRQLSDRMAGAMLPSMSVAVRVDPAQSGVVDGIRSRLSAIDDELPVADLRLMEARLADSVARPRLYAVLLAIFAGLALVLATSGVYSVISYSVSQRTRETGVRMAFGATSSDIVRLVLRDGLRILAWGLGLGLIAAIALGRSLASVLFEVHPADPVTFAVVAIVLGAAVLAASAVPARQAARTDAIKALRYE